jgi:hypothetical protein
MKKASGDRIETLVCQKWGPITTKENQYNITKLISPRRHGIAEKSTEKSKSLCPNYQVKNLGDTTKLKLFFHRRAAEPQRKAGK